MDPLADFLGFFHVFNVKKVFAVGIVNRTAIQVFRKRQCGFFFQKERMPKEKILWRVFFTGFLMKQSV